MALSRSLARARSQQESLLIVGVAEPLVLIYTFLYRFAIEQSPTLLASAGSVYSPAELFLPWGEEFFHFFLFRL